MVECANITIERDFLVENQESFLFQILQAQTDPAVVVGTPSSATVTILDEPDGTCIESIGKNHENCYAPIQF